MTLRSIKWQEREDEPPREFIMCSGIAPVAQPIRTQLVPRPKEGGAEGETEMVRETIDTPVIIGEQQVRDILSICRRRCGLDRFKHKHAFYQRKIAAFAPLVEDGEG